eukprot:scaffold206701_cov14-Tisochrysis_lutea.AAC.1
MCVHKCKASTVCASIEKGFEHQEQERKKVLQHPSLPQEKSGASSKQLANTGLQVHVPKNSKRREVQTTQKRHQRQK